MESDTDWLKAYEACKPCAEKGIDLEVTPWARMLNGSTGPQCGYCGQEAR